MRGRRVTPPSASAGVSTRSAPRLSTTEWGVILNLHPGGYRRSRLIEDTTAGAPTTKRVRLLDARGVFTPALVVSHPSVFPQVRVQLAPHPWSGILRGPNTRGKDPS